MGVVAIQVTQDDVAEIGGLNAQAGELLIDALPQVKLCLVDVIEQATAEALDLCLLVEDALGRDASMPARIQKDFALRMLDEVAGDG